MKVIHCDWLKTQIGVFRDKAEAIEVLNETDGFFEKCEDGMAGFSCGKDGDGLPLFFIFIARKPHPPTTIQGLIVHEVSHLVDILLDNKGIETRSVNTEVRAHMNEWLFTAVLEIIQEQEKPKRKKK